METGAVNAILSLAWKNIIWNLANSESEFCESRTSRGEPFASGTAWGKQIFVSLMCLLWQAVNGTVCIQHSCYELHLSRQVCSLSFLKYYKLWAVCLPGECPSPRLSLEWVNMMVCKHHSFIGHICFDHTSFLEPAIQNNPSSGTDWNQKKGCQVNPVSFKSEADTGSTHRWYNSLENT